MQRYESSYHDTQEKNWCRSKILVQSEQHKNQSFTVKRTIEITSKYLWDVTFRKTQLNKNNWQTTCVTSITQRRPLKTFDCSMM